MKTSRILCSLIVLGTFSGSAFAALPLPDGKCFEISDGPNYNMIVYFENDYPKTKPGASNPGDGDFDDIEHIFKSATGGARQCYRNMKEALKTKVLSKITKQDEAIFLLASTDTLASADYNVELATRRANLIIKALNEIDAGATLTSSDQVKMFIGGESNAAVESPESGSNPQERAVRIIVKKANYEPQNNYHKVELTNNINIQNNQSTSFSATTQINVNYDDNELQMQNRKTQIGLIVSELNRMNDNFSHNRSHWKTANGNFNGARLASDSIAGVVLGTAGGLITSNIIKKNQMRSGFEDLQCVIGGQIVANYDDDFTINMNLNR